MLTTFEYHVLIVLNCIWIVSTHMCEKTLLDVVVCIMIGIYRYNQYIDRPCGSYRWLCNLNEMHELIMTNVAHLYRDRMLHIYNWNDILKDIVYKINIKQNALPFLVETIEQNRLASIKKQRTLILQTLRCYRDLERFANSVSCNVWHDGCDVS